MSSKQPAKPPPSQVAAKPPPSQAAAKAKSPLSQASAKQPLSQIAAKPTRREPKAKQSREPKPSQIAANQIQAKPNCPDYFFYILPHNPPDYNDENLSNLNQILKKSRRSANSLSFCELTRTMSSPITCKMLGLIKV